MSSTYKRLSTIYLCAMATILRQQEDATKIVLGTILSQHDCSEHFTAAKACHMQINIYTFRIFGHTDGLKGIAKPVTKYHQFNSHCIVPIITKF